jgi:hypothetical protein
MTWETGSDAGARDRAVRLEQMTESRDTTTKAVVETWTTLVAVVWMARRDRADQSAQERVVANQTSAAFDTRWEMNYRADMDPDSVDVAKARRLVYRGRTYGIVFGRQIGTKAGIELFTLAAGKVA